ncbi:MAG: M1 family metallopeptidase [Bacteroidetes bacterium]|nr:M1 family metallopeptidase [Bacteroidota bacterium]MBS1739202.1 M1 family metallopeptidase [Bacteroidota bacterium]
MKYYYLLFLLSISFKNFGQTYWQQKVDTRIDVTLDDRKHMLHGFETFVYTNHSPDTLQFLYIHLWPNAYSNDHTPFAEQQYRNKHTDFYFAKNHDRGFIDSLQFAVNGTDVAYFYGENTPDIARINLPMPLAPGNQITVTTPFRVKIPKVFSRLGHTNQAYYISQWFPKPAVYDRKGWHPLSYLDLGEFYSEFGSYDIYITLPENYVVMATGNLQTEKEEKWLDSLSKLPIRKDTLRKIITTKIVNGQKKHTVTYTDFPESATQMKTIHFTENKVHDFAWFADKRWVFRKDTVLQNNHEITTWSAFLPSYEKQWKKSNTYLAQTIKHYGNWLGAYPYQTIKAVQGDMKAGGGMEYPTITIIDKNAGEQSVIIHEAGHNWFYGMLASNERDHAWMDEGLNTYYEQKTVAALSQTKKDSLSTRTTKRKNEISVSLNMRTILAQLAASGNDQAIAQTAAKFREINYGMDVYYKTAEFMRWLEIYMGKDSFALAMQDYFETWKFKHPYPDDFVAVLQKHTDKDLSWLFKDAFYSDKRFDFSLKNGITKNNFSTVVLSHQLPFALPASIQAYQGDSILKTVSVAPFTGSTVVEIPANNWTKLKLAPEVFDENSVNNTFKRKGIFKRGIPSIKPFFGFTEDRRRKIFLLPAIGFNKYDGFEGGLLIHNLTIPETKLKFAFAPMYGFHSKQFIGAGSVCYVIQPNSSIFKEITVQLDAKTFHNQSLLPGFNRDSSVYIPNNTFAQYYKVAPSLLFRFKEPSFTSPITRTLLVKAFFINEEDFSFAKDHTDSLFKPFISQQANNYALVRYVHNNMRTFNPFSYSGEAQWGKNFIKLNLEANLRIDYHAKNKALHVRVYGGKFFDLGNNISNDRYYLNSTFTGVNDYLYEDTYLGRTDRSGFGVHQISMREGGLKVPTPLYASPLGRSDNWLASINLKTDLPLGKIPLRIFADVASFADAGRLNPSGSKTLFDAGLELYIFDIVNVYLPLVYSKDYNDYRKSILGRTNIFDGITFSINLQSLNWLQAARGVMKLGSR